VNEYLPFVVIGLTTGSVYALAAVGLVLTYKTSRIFNFAHGSLATVTVLIFFALVYRADIPWHVAAALAVLGIGPAVGVAFQLLGGRLSPLTTEAKVLATIGLVLFISGVVTLWGTEAYGNGPVASVPSLPGSLVRIFGVNVGVDQIIIVIVGLIATLLLHLVLEYSAIGRSMRAVVDDPDLLALAGRNPIAAQRAGWALGIGFVTLSGLLLVLSPNNSVPAATLDLLVLQAFGAAAIGGFTSLPLTYVGGLLIGVVSALSTEWVARVPLLGGLPSALPFVVLFIVLVAMPRHLAPQTDRRALPVRLRVIEIPRIWRLPLGGLVVAALVVVPLSKNLHLVYTANEALPYAVIFLGLGLLVRTSGQVSLCQMGLAAVGASIFAHAADSFGVPWFGAVLLGGVAAAAVGAIVAIPAIRVAGIYLAIATYGFGVLLEQFLYSTKFLFGNGDVIATRPVVGPFNASDDVTYFVILAVIFVLSLMAVTAVRRARLGRLLRALGDSPEALEAQGTSINVTRVAVFAISAFLAGVGGALLVSQLNFLDANPFGSMSSLTVVVVLLTLRVTEPLTSLVAAAAVVMVPSFLSNQGSVWWLDIGFGGAAIVTALSGSATWLPRWRWTAAPPRALARRSRRQPPFPRDTNSAPYGLSRTGLELYGVSVRFKGVLAVDQLSLKVPMNRITGLIGPNGAGKTTTFNVCSGLVQPQRGRLLLHGREISSLSPSARARRGLGRTFQQIDLFDSLTVRENVELGAEGAMAGARLLGHVVGTPTQVAMARESASAAMELVGITSLYAREVRTLSTGEKRLVELARCLAGKFDLLLLDEPSSGLDSNETQMFGEILAQVVDERGLGILIVEHNMSLVFDICARVYVLDFGQLIFEGSPHDAFFSDAVRAAYLGTSAIETFD
jgi:ABC-type branched-subunit amino acid transport system ATPase component/branched-subunit amino acid ABC-type transport system permease component